MNQTVEGVLDRLAPGMAESNRKCGLISGVGKRADDLKHLELVSACVKHGARKVSNEDCNNQRISQP